MEFVKLVGWMQRVAQDLGTVESICWQNESFPLVELCSSFCLHFPKDFQHMTLESGFNGRKRQSSVVVRFGFNE